MFNEFTPLARTRVSYTPLLARSGSSDGNGSFFECQEAKAKERYCEKKIQRTAAALAMASCKLTWYKMVATYSPLFDGTQSWPGSIPSF